MRDLLNRQRGQSRRWALRLAGTILVGFGLSGCASFWDDVTSRNFEFKTLWSKPDPLVVLNDPEHYTGNIRAQALAALREPKQYGGTDQEQEVVVKILTTAAREEKAAYCRLAAIRALGQFKDPRAEDGLEKAYYAAATFAPDQRTLLACQALTALGETHNPAAVQLLTRAVRAPAEGAGQPLRDKKQVLDERLAAARALANFNQKESTEALFVVLQTEKDVALHDEAVASLRTSTGKELPPDVRMWDEYLHHERTDTRATVEADQPRLYKLLNFWQPSNEGKK